MLRSQNKVFLIALGILLCLGRLHGQEDLPPVQKDPGSKKEKGSDPGEDKKEEDTAKLAYLRIWCFAGKGDTQKNGVFLRKKNEPTSEAIWVGRGIRYGTLAKYRPIQEGTYELWIVAETAEAIDPDKPVKFDISTKNEVQDVEVVLKAKGYQTLVIQDNNKKVSASLIDDKALKDGLHTLRAVNYTNSTKASIVQISAGQRTTLFDNLEPDKMVTKEITGNGRLQLEMTYLDDKGFPMTQSAEIDFTGLLSASMVLYYDRYDRITLRCVEDSPSK